MSRKRYGNYFHDYAGPVYFVLGGVPLVIFFVVISLFGVGFVVWFLLLLINQALADRLLLWAAHYGTLHWWGIWYTSLGLLASFLFASGLYTFGEVLNWMDKRLLEINPNR